MSKNSENTVLALLAGAAIGAGIGILFAPDKGSKTREKLKDGFDDAKGDFKNKLNSTSDRLVEKAFLAKDDLEGNYENLVSKLSDKTEDVITFLESKLADLKIKNAKFQK